MPVVVFTPKADGKYRIVLKLARCKAGGSFACYATLRDGGFDVPVNNLATAGGRLISLCETVNDKLARVQTIKRFAIIPREFSIDGGELTPTMKVKRKVVNEKYKNEIEAMYPAES